jgi:hypothetical protein
MHTGWMSQAAKGQRGGNWAPAAAIGTPPAVSRPSGPDAKRRVRARFLAHSGVTALARQHSVAPFWQVATYQLNVFALT